VQDGIRTYYPGIPDFIQVGEHQFVQQELAHLWITEMLTSWFVPSPFGVTRQAYHNLYRTSATNCARIYDHALVGPHASDIEGGGWQFGIRLTTEHVWDAFVILSLLRDHAARNWCMQAPHIGSQRDRFVRLMEERNRRIVQEGQAEVSHYCDKCLRLYVNPDDQMGKHILSFLAVRNDC
jgi:CxC5 like cysteine cluster associated with KDZ transposases